jgi:hypothetical protein
MRLAGVAMVRDEADIIEPFVRTNLALLDVLYVMIHRSSDGTREILQALYREGLQIRLMEIQEEAYRQEHHTNFAVRVALREERADFAFPIDADEFVRARDRASLEAALAALPAGTPGVMPWINYAPTAQDRASPNPLARLERRVRMSPIRALELEYCKVVVGPWFNDLPDGRILEGAHVVFDGPRQIPVQVLEGVTMCHYPVRSGEHLAQKAVLGWLAHLLRGVDIESSNVAGHWRRIFQGLKERGTVTEEDFRAFLDNYLPPASRGNDLIHDPLPHRVDTLRYAALQRRPGLLQALLERAEALARLAAAAQPPSRT